MVDRPPHPGREPWAPAVWVAFAIPMTCAAIAFAFDYNAAHGSLLGSLVCIAYSFVWRWRWGRWFARAKAWQAWLSAELEAGRRLPDDIRFKREV